MTNSFGSSQCDPALPIPDIFWDMETNPSYQAIGSERQIFSMSVNKTYNLSSFFLIGDCDLLLRKHIHEYV